MTEPPRRPSSPPPYQQASTRADVTAAWEARRELGPEYDEHVASGLADRVEELVAYRTAELQARGAAADASIELERTGQRHGFVLGIVSLGVGLPITGIAAEEGSIAALLVAWTGIVGVNVAHRLGRRRRS